MLLLLLIHRQCYPIKKSYVVYPEEQLNLSLDLSFKLKNIFSENNISQMSKEKFDNDELAFYFFHEAPPIHYYFPVVEAHNYSIMFSDVQDAHIKIKGNEKVRLDLLYLADNAYEFEGDDDIKAINFFQESNLFQNYKGKCPVNAYFFTNLLFSHFNGDCSGKLTNVYDYVIYLYGEGSNYQIYIEDGYWRIFANDSQPSFQQKIFYSDALHNLDVVIVVQKNISISIVKGNTNSGRGLNITLLTESTVDLKSLSSQSSIIRSYYKHESPPVLNNLNSHDIFHVGFYVEESLADFQWDGILSVNGVGGQILLEQNKLAESLVKVNQDNWEPNLDSNLKNTLRSFFGEFGYFTIFGLAIGGLVIVLLVILLFWHLCTNSSEDIKIHDSENIEEFGEQFQEEVLQNNEETIQSNQEV